MRRQIHVIAKVPNGSVLRSFFLLSLRPDFDTILGMSITGVASYLEAQFLKGGKVDLDGSSHSSALDLSELTGLLKRFSGPNASPTCELVVITNYTQATGSFDLQNVGTSSNPILPLTFKKCTLTEDLTLSGAYMSKLEIIGCNFREANTEPGKIGSILADNSTVIGRVLIEDCPVGPQKIDFSDSDLRQGVLIRRVGQPTNGSVCASSVQQISFAGARVGAGILLERVSVQALDPQKSVDAEELTLARTLRFQSCDFTGQLRLRGAHISGQLVFESVTIKALPPGSEKFPLAIMGEGLSVGGDLFFGRSREAFSKECAVEGQIDFVGANIGGEFHVYGTYNATEHRMRAFKGLRMKIGGSLRFGWIPDSARSCKVVGECDFSEATISGGVICSGSEHGLNVAFKKSTAIRRMQGQAFNLRGATINGDLHLEGSANQHSIVEGISLIGATVGGRFLIRGADIIANWYDNAPRKAITANGATIRGGIQITQDEYDEISGNCRRSKIVGDIRLRRASVGGPVIFRGVDLQAYPHGRGRALWASGTNFGSDVIFEPIGAEMSKIEGELRFWGATIAGTLWIQGVQIVAQKSATALDCYSADIQRGAVIGDFDPVKKGRTGPCVPCEIKGLVSFNFSQVQSLIIGSDPSVSCIGKEYLTLTGALLMRDIKVQGGTVISNVVLKSAEHLCDGLRTLAVERLRELAIYRPFLSLHASYGCLGTRLFVHLRIGSAGLINLYAATAGTIGALTGYQASAPEQKRIHEDWGKPFDERSLWPRGKPRKEEEAEKGILLNLDEFSFQHVNDDTEEKYAKESRWPSWDRFCGRPSRKSLMPRFGWLQVQVENPGVSKDLVVSPYRQLAKVYRETGDMQRSYGFIRERRCLQIEYGNFNWLQRRIDSLFSFAFGFGYSPARASATLAALYLFSLGLIAIAVNSRVGASNTCNLPQVWWDALGDAYKLISPISGVHEAPACYMQANALNGACYELVRVLGWIIFPLAAITYSGVLREKHDS